MAEALYLVTKANANAPSETIVDDIHCCLINSDDGGSDADIIAEAEVKVKTVHAIPSGYFDTVIAVGDLTSGPLKDDTDTMIVLSRSLETVEA